MRWRVLESQIKAKIGALQNGGPHLLGYVAYFFQCQFDVTEL